MKKYVIGLICSIILFLFFIGSTVYEVINTTKLDKKTTSTNVESVCHAGSGIDDMPYECIVKYHFSYKDNIYTCNENITSMTKKDYKENKTVYFQSSNPNNCSVKTKSNYIVGMVIADIISIIVVLFLASAVKKTSKTC